MYEKSTYIWQRFSARSTHSTLRLHRLRTADLYNEHLEIQGGERTRLEWAAENRAYRTLENANILFKWFSFICSCPSSWWSNGEPKCVQATWSHGSKGRAGPAYETWYAYAFPGSRRAQARTSNWTSLPRSRGPNDGSTYEGTYATSNAGWARCWKRYANRSSTPSSRDGKLCLDSISPSIYLL